MTGRPQIPDSVSSREAVPSLSRVLIPIGNPARLWYTDTMKLFRALLILVLLQSTAWLSQAQAMINYNTPEAVTGALYDTAYQYFGFSPDTLWRTRPYLSHQLYSRLWFKVNQPASGAQKDVFFCSETPPADYSVGKVSTKGGKSRVDVTLTWLSRNGPKTHVWVLLKQNDGVWQVDDIDYGIFGKLSNYL